MGIITHEFKIKNKLGLHARPAALFVQTVSKFDSDITVVKDDQEVNGKSIMNIMTLAAGKGSVIKVVFDGEDAEDALAALKVLFDDQFGEE